VLHRMRSFFAAWLLALSAISFSYAQEDPNTETQEENDGNADTFLIWLSDDKGRITTYWFSTTRNTAPTVQAKTGLFLITRNKLHALEYKKRRFSCCDCNQWMEELQHDEEVVCPPKKKKTSNFYLLLQSLTDQDTLTLIAPLSEAETVNLGDFEDELRLRGVVGQYLFLTQSRYLSHCMSAHGHASSRMILWDAAKGEKVDPRMLFKDDPQLKEAANRALQAFRADKIVTAKTTKDLELAAIYPRYDETGRLRITWQFTAKVCYADSDWLWSSYTRSTWVEGDAPAVFRENRVPPPAVTGFLKSHHRDQLVGWAPLTLNEAEEMEYRKALSKAEAREIMLFPLSPMRQP